MKTTHIVSIFAKPIVNTRVLQMVGFQLSPKSESTLTHTKTVISSCKDCRKGTKSADLAKILTVEWR